MTPAPYLSLCVIVRNETAFIEGCLKSVRDFVDEMILVDTGSTDGTGDLARGLGAAVYEFPWTGDFSAARNHSLAQAKGQWILVLDADERLAERDARQIRHRVSSTSAHGLKLIQRTYLHNANFVCASSNPGDYEEGRQYTDCINVDVIRLFRNDPRIRYSGRVHELVEPVFASTPGLNYETTDLVIHHFGKVGDPASVHRKKLLYLDLGHKKAVEDPSNALAQFELGVQFYELDRFEECLSPFKAARKLNPAYDLALLYIAKALHTLGRMEEAAAYFQDSLKQSPNNDKVLFDYANFIRDRGDARAALKLYRKAIVANPRHSLAHFNMGVLYVRTGDIEKGRSLMEQAIRLNPGNGSFHENLGRLSLAIPNLGDVTPMLESYLKRFPGSLECLSVLAEIYFKANRFHDALSAADRALALGTPQLGVLLTRAKASFSLRMLDEAESAYRSALALAPDNLDSMMNLASIAEIRGDEATARSSYLRILDKHPGQELALKRLAMAQTRLGLDAEVADALDRACAADSIDPQSLVLVGSLFEKAGRIERATELYRSAASKKPEWACTMNRRVQQLQLGMNERRNIHDSIGL